MTRSALALFFVLTSSGCFLFPSSDPSPPLAQPIEVQGTPDASWALDIGTGEPEFAPLENGAHVPAQHGAQGGSHVWTSLKLERVTVDIVQVEIEVDDANGAVVSRSVSAAGAKPNADGLVVVPWLQAFITNDFHGAARIHFRIASSDGSKWATAEREVIVD